MKNILKITTVLLFLLLFLQVKSQRDRVSFSRVSVNQGLSQSSVFSIAQDHLGYIWIATFDGLNRYDGSSFEVFTADKSNPYSLQDNYIQSLCVDNEGVLWIGTNSKGLCWYDNIKKHFISLPQKSKVNDRGLNGSSVLTLKKMGKDSLLVLTEKGINIMNVVTRECVQITTESYQKNKNSVSLISYFNQEINVDKTINCYLTDRTGDSWEGTKKGLIRIKNKDHKKIIYRHQIHDNSSLSSNEITCLYEDISGSIWVGTSLGGVNRWDRNYEGLLLYRNNPFDDGTISDNKIRSFYEDSKHRVWVGTVGGGVNLWNRKDDTFRSWNKKNNTSISSDEIRDVAEWKGQYVIATDGGGAQFFNPDQTPMVFTSIKEIPLDARVWDLQVEGGNLWVSTFNYGLFKLSDNGVNKFETEIPTEKVTWVYSDEKGSIWVGTFELGIFRFYNGEVTNWNQNNSDLSDNRVYSIVPDNNGDLWIGTKNGVNHLLIEANTINSYTVKDGLPNATVMGIIEGKKEDVWLSTNKGICNLFYNKDSVVNYDVKDGLQGNEFLIHSFIKLSTGEMIFGGVSGFNVSALNRVVNNTAKPKILITGFKVNDSSWAADTVISLKQVINLAYDENELSFEFTALSFAGSLNKSFQYKMDGYDKVWRKNGHRRFVQYTNLSPGNYVFRVRSTSKFGVKDQVPTIIRVIIHPAFWQTWWFKIGVGLIVFLLIILLYKVRSHQLINKNNWLEGEVEVRTQEINEKNLVIKEAFNDVQNSIKYAKRIQKAILPPASYFQDELKNAFVLYTPKDIVAGDFYWLEQTADVVFFAAADCTGHGVPGAIVSVVCNNALNRSVREYGLLDLGEILDKTREIIIQEFEKSDEEVKDGMDIALCALSTKDNDGPGFIQFAGANNPLWIVRHKTNNFEELAAIKAFEFEDSDYLLLEIKGDKQPIGQFEKQKPFKSHRIKLQKGDAIYIFSDGYVDQFGGEKGKKFKARAFRELLISIQNKSMSEQKEVLEQTFKSWRRDLEQVDDVCVIGVKI